MSVVIQFLENWTADDGNVFQAGQEFTASSFSKMPYMQECGPCQFKEVSVIHYHFTHDGVYYHVPYMFAAPTNKRTPNEDNRTRQQKEIDRQTTDAYQEPSTVENCIVKHGEFDMVAAVKDFYGVDISAKPFGDQADYATPERILNELEKVVPYPSGAPSIPPTSIGSGPACIPAEEPPAEEAQGDYNHDFDQP